MLGGDGLELDGDTLYNVRGSGDAEISVLEVRSTRSGWKAAWFGRRTAPSLDVPTTATVAGGWLYAVNARFGISDPDAARYWISRLVAR